MEWRVTLETRYFALFLAALGILASVTSCQSVCPNRCLCHRNQQLRTIACSRQGLQVFPENISDVVEHLDLSSNLLKEIPDDVNRLTDLQYLNLARNQLTSLPSNLERLKNLRSLDLTANNIDHVMNIASISQLPALIVMYLSRNPLIDLEGLTSTVLQALDASHCDIRELGNASLDGLPALTTLSLTGNPLRAIDRPSNGKLRWLDMSNCQLNYLEPDTFVGFPELEELRLADNPRLVYSTRHSTLRHRNIKKLDVSKCNLDRPGLHGLPLLTQARLSRNKIRPLPDRIFSKNRKLTHLFLNSNGLEYLNVSTFEGLIKLQILDLSANALEEVHELTFQDNVELRLLNLSYNALFQFPNLSALISSLDVSSNFIASLNKDSLSGMPRLRSLNLNDNKLRYIPNGLRSSSLNILNIRRNRLVQLSNNSLVELPELQRIDLSGNRLTEAMSHEAFRNNPSLSVIQLEDNPWRCDCIQLFLTYEFLTEPPAKTLGTSLICQSPANVSGFSWESACFEVWHESLYYRRDKTWGLVLISLLTLIILFGSIVSIRHTMKIKRRAIEQRQELERAEARERLRLLQRRSQCSEEEPRINPLELIGPPSYEEAVQMPRLAHSLDALNEVSVENISMRTLGSVDNLRSKKRRTRRPRKRTQSVDDLLRRQERREVRRRRESNNSTGNICETDQTQIASRANSRSSSVRKSKRQSVLEDGVDSGSSKGRPRPQTPTARKKRRRQVVMDGHSTDDEDSEVQIIHLTRSMVIREFRREPRSGYRERPTDQDS